jgi:hypothetical protein
MKENSMLHCVVHVDAFVGFDRKLWKLPAFIIKLSLMLLENPTILHPSVNSDKLISQIVFLCEEIQ